MDSEKPADVSPLPPAAPPTIGPVLLDSENPQKWPQTRKCEIEALDSSSVTLEATVLDDGY